MLPSQLCPSCPLYLECLSPIFPPRKLLQPLRCISLSRKYLQAAGESSSTPLDSLTSLCPPLTLPWPCCILIVGCHVSILLSYRIYIWDQKGELSYPAMMSKPTKKKKDSSFLATAQPMKSHGLCVYCSPPNFLFSIKAFSWTSLVVQWLRIHLPMQETWVRSLVQEYSTYCTAT